MRMKDKVTLITGGGAGIGKATAQRFVEEGAKIAICDVNQEAGGAVVQALGSEHSFHVVDVTDRDAVQAWVDEVAEKYGRIDVLVNNAGVLRDNQLIKMKYIKKDKMIFFLNQLSIAINPGQLLPAWE